MELTGSTIDFYIVTYIENHILKMIQVHRSGLINTLREIEETGKLIKVELKPS